MALAIKKHGDKPAAVIRDLFLATLNREPTSKEVATIETKFPFTNTPRAKMQADDLRSNPEHKYQDLLWALVNSNEFLLNH